jgi:superfamily II DNA or RNA helicase
MPLRRLSFEEDYRTGDHNILNEVFRPALGEATRYWRAVGYFSSSALESFGAPLSTFIRNKGTIRLITSVELREDDIAAIEKGQGKREVSERRIGEIIDEQFSKDINDGVAALAALLQIGRFDIRIAIPKRGYGIYHEKVGVFFDDSDYVAFSGSTNESKHAFEENYESVDVYPSWTVPTRAERKLKHFERLWNGKDPGADTYEFPDAAREKLIRIAAREPGAAYGPTSVRPTSWHHQERALDLFIRAERGVLNMATGTGKTRTALNIVERLMTGLIDIVIISTEGNDLLEQWYGNVVALLARMQTRVRVYRHFHDHKDVNEFVLGTGKRILVCSRLNVDMAMRKLTANHGQRMLLIEDEVHGLGSPASRQRLEGLSDRVRFRLGLSATPDREYDAEGNEFIESYIGPVVFEFGLADAIRAGILAPFAYHALEYRIDSDDRQALAAVYKRKAAREAAGTPMSKEEIWIEISKVYKTSKAKLPIFENFIRGRPELLQRCIVFVETHEYGDEVLERVHRVHPDFRSYFSGEDSATLRRFAKGELQCLVTCHRLSQGIDIQSLGTVVLFSSARARLETIQRMGRCLRKDPNDPAKIANVVDFIRLPDIAGDENTDGERRQWLEQLSMVRMTGA